MHRKSDLHFGWILLIYLLPSKCTGPSAMAAGARRNLLARSTESNQVMLYKFAYRHVLNQFPLDYLQPFLLAICIPFIRNRLSTRTWKFPPTHRKTVMTPPSNCSSTGAKGWVSHTVTTNFSCITTRVFSSFLNYRARPTASQNPSKDTAHNASLSTPQK